MNTLSIVQIVLGILSIAGVLLQSSTTGIEGAFGGGSATESVKLTKRGPERFLFQATIVVIIAFIAVCVLGVIK